VNLGFTIKNPPPIYYVVEINITEILTPRSFYPRLRLGLITVDKYELEDLILYCRIKYTIIRGYYFTGTSVSVSDFVNRMYTRKQRAEGVERDVIKKALNSIYGNTLRKGYKRELHKFFDTDEFQEYISRHSDRIEHFDPKKRQVWLNKCLDTSSNHCQIGAAILSYSKHIMNKYLNCADAEGIPVYMSNNDSIMIPTCCVHKFQKWISGKIGDLHVENQSNEAIVIRANCYYMSDSWFRYSGKCHSHIATMDDIRSFYLSLL
jgi:hypothetical protein